VIRRIQFLAFAIFLIIAAFSTGADFLFFLVYLGILVIGGSYVVTRFGLSDLEAGYSLDRLHGHVGDTLRATYTVRNTSRLPKLWLEVHNPTTLPVPLPGRGLALGSRGERSWVARVPLTRRGHYRVDPMVIRTGDPFGFFESYASVGTGATVIVYPHAEALLRWKLPPATLEGAHSSPERTIQTTPLVTSIRPYTPGDAFNRIHWKSSARQQELQVKEFDLERTADVWLFLDLDGSVQAGEGEEATVETGVRVAASIAAHALVENRSVGFSASAHRRAVIPADRGARQHQKILQLLAAVEGDGTVPLRELLVENIPRLRQGMTAVVITPSLERDWVRPLATLRGRGVTTVVCLLDPVAHEDATRRQAAMPPLQVRLRDERARAARALRHALAEHDLTIHTVEPGRPLGDQLVSVPSGRSMVAR
jgi:uncharacterized protein (DUF58 family)